MLDLLQNIAGIWGMLIVGLLVAGGILLLKGRK